MARQVDIDFQLNEKPVVTSLGKMLSVLMRLNAEKEALAPKGKIKLELETVNVRKQTEDLTNLNKELRKTATSMDKMAKASEGLSNSGVTINNTFNNHTSKVFKTVTEDTEKATENVNKMALSFAGAEIAMKSMMGVIKLLDKEFMQLSENTFGVGVASQLALNQIVDLNNQFLELSKGTPTSAKALAKATDDLVRTGRSLGEAQTMMAEISKLSVASSESLQDTAGVATKIMVSLGIEAKNTEKALTALHSVAIQTASSMGGLAESFKQYAGTLGVFVSTASASGQELENYKQNILELGLSATGVLNNLGLSSESAGTKVKLLFSKLVAMEKTATNLFNQDMTKANIFVDVMGNLSDSTNGSLLTTERLSEIAKTNLPQAIQLLSQIQAQGDLSTKTLQKMFTGRHFTEVSAILRAVGGDWQKFNKIYAQGVEYQEDYVKQMYNVNHAISTLKNNLISLGKDGFGFLGTTIEGGTFIANKMFEGIDDNITKIISLSSHAVGFSATALAVGKSVSLVSNAMKGFSLATAGATIATKGFTGALMANPVGLVAVGITALTTALIHYGKSMREAEIQTLSTFEAMKNITKLGDTAKALDDRFQSIKMSLYDIEGIGELEKTTYSLAGLVGLTSDWEQGIHSAKEALAGLSKGLDKDDIEKKMESIRIQTSVNAKSIEKYSEDLKQDILRKSVTVLSSEKQRGFEKAVGDIFKALETGNLDGQKIEMKSFKDIQNEIKKRSGVDISTMQMGRIFNDNKNAEELQKALTEQDNLNKEGIQIEKDYQKEKDSLLKNQLVLEKQREDMFLDNAKFEAEILKKYGKLIKDGKELVGIDALKFVTEKSFGQNEESIKQFKVIQKQFEEMNQGFKMDGSESMDYYLKFIDILKEIDSYKELISTATTEKEKEQNEIMLKQAKEKLGLLKQEEDFRKQALELERKSSEYRFKYVSDAKKMLDVEYELLKIGQDKHYQTMLSYEMSQKELENRKMMAEEGLKDIGFSLGNKSVEQAMDETKQKLDEIRAKGAVRTGAKEDYEQYSQLKELYDLLQKVYEAEQKIELHPIKLMNEVLRDSPSVIMSAIASLNTFDDVFKEIDIAKMEREFSQKHVDTLLGRYNKSYGSETNQLGELDVTEKLNQKRLEYAKKVQDLEQKGIKATKDEIKATKDLQNEVLALVDIEKQRLAVKQAERKEIEAEMAIYGQLGGAMSTLGSIFGVDAFGQIGNMITQFGDVGTKFKTGDMGIDLGKMMGADGKLDMNAVGKNFESIMAVGQLGSMGGQLMGGLLGGNSQMAGDLGGIGAMAGMMVGGPAGAMIGSALGGALGGMMGGSAEKDQAKAQEKTAEANRLYQENTDALNKLATNMANLNSGIDSLNSSLLSSFSQLPTTGNLNNVTDAMKTMNKTLLSSRDFGDIAYQITKSKKSGGGLFGGKQTVQWTETHTKSLQQMLGQYGYKGSINDMTSEELRDFSEWLEDVKIGESSNVKGMAQIIADYAQALDAMENNIEDFFYDATMEGFEGISSLAQEELKNQLTEFYKNLGMNIDEDLQAEIDKLAEEMSVMITVMKDVRGEFLNVWKETGKDAGSAFVSAMKPYMESMLGNISQVYYDVFFSDVTENLEDSFKKISEQLVEMKKQGADLDWGDVTNKLAEQFDNVLSAIISAKQQTESFNDVILALQKQALEAGLTLSELFELGLVTGTQGDVLDTFKDAIMSDQDGGALTAIGDFMGDKIGEALTNTLMDNLFSTQILDFANQLDNVLSGEIKFSQLAGLMSQATSIGLGIEQQRLQMEAILAGFKFDQDIIYESSSSKVEYSSGSSQQNTYVYNISSSINAGNVIESDSINSLADELLDTIIEKLRVDKGIDITKNY